MVDPTDWSVSPAPWLGLSDHVLRLTVSDDQQHRLALVGNGGIGAVSLRGEVTAVDGQPSARVLAVIGAITLRVAGRPLVEVPVPDLSPGRERVAALRVG